MYRTTREETREPTEKTRSAHERGFRPVSAETTELNAQ